MMSHTFVFSGRFRPVLMSLLIVASGMTFQAAPTTLPIARPEALRPQVAKAVTCATNPTFTGRLTASSSSTTAVSRITDPDVYGYISNVDGTWSCTASVRYSAIAWNTTATKGTFNWGNLINSTSVPCNWVVNSTNYLKNNSTSSCATSDSQYAMKITLDTEQVYQQDKDHLAKGDFSYAHSDCDTYHGAEPIKLDVTFNTGNTNNRPATSNCDPITLDGTGTSQTVTYDNTPPTVNFDTPDEAAPLATVTLPSYTVQFDAKDSVAGFGGVNGWTLQRQIAAWDGSACGTFATDPAIGATSVGTANADNQTVGQTLAAGSCYRWTLGATDQNSKSASTTSGPVRRDVSAALGTQSYRAGEGWDLGGGDGLTVDVVTRNLVINHPITSLPIQGSSVSVNLAYNSQDPVSVGLGRGWRLDAQRRLTLNGDGSVTFIGPDGARHTFLQSWTVGGTVTTYTRPSTLYATLRKDTALTANEFVLTYRDKSVDKFDILGSEGILVRAEDRHGNGVSLSYVGTTNRIDKITDTAASPNRTIDFAYDGSNRIASITDWAYVSGGVVQATATGSRRQTRFFYDGSSNMTGWADPISTSGGCPTGGSHVTCLTYSGALVTAVAKTQTVETLASGNLGSTTRTITTAIAYVGGEVATITDAEEQSKGSPARTTFSRPAADQIKVVRPGSPASEATYGLVSASDALGRIQSVWRKLVISSVTYLVEQRTAYDGTYSTEPASITQNQGALLSTPAPTTSYTYVSSSLGLVSRTTEPLTGSTNRTTDHTYNANNDVTQQVVALDGSGTIRTITRYCYASSGCATNATDLVLRSTIRNYVDGTPGNGVANVEDVTTTYQYDAYGQRTRETRSNYDSAGTLLDSAASESTYDDMGNRTSSIANYADGSVDDPGDDITPNATTGARTDLTTAFTYDTAGNQTSRADPRRAIETAKGTSLNADDFTTRSVFDALNQVTKETAARTPDDTVSPKFSTSTYDELWQVRESVDMGGLVNATEFDRAGRLAKSFEDPDGAGGTDGSTTAEATYDAAGRSLVTKDRLQVLTSSLGTTTTVYDELGRTTLVTEAAGSSPDIATATSTTYDALDRATTVTVGGVQTTMTTYDLGGRAATTDDEFTCTSATFDYRDLTTGKVEGQVSGSCSGPGSRTTTNTYDGLGHLTNRSVTGGDVLEAATYDSVGNRLSTSATTAGVTTSSAFTLNPLDQVTGETRSDAGTATSWTKANYDPVGNRTDRCVWNTNPGSELCMAVGGSYTTSPAVNTTTAYDARNNRVSLKVPGIGETTYDPAHNYAVDKVYVPTRLNGSNQVIAERLTNYAYDSRHRLTSISESVCPVTAGTHSCTGSPVTTGSDTYIYDDNDNRTSVAESKDGGSAVTTTYCYDALNRLVAAKLTTTCSTGPSESYAYDTAGNRTQAIVSGVTTNFAYTAAGQLCMTGATTCTSPNVTYDAAGRTSSWNGWTLTYDGEGRLASACKVSGCATGDMVTMRYDGEGRRIELVSRPNGGSTTTTTFRYQGSAISQELTNGTVSREYVTDDDGRIVKVCDPSCAAPTTTYLVTWNGHGDALGLWRINADGTLTLANSYSYTSWGAPTTTVASGLGDLKFRFLYVGAADVQWDDAGLGLGLYYMHARHFSPALARFIQPDPSAAEANLYGYAGSNPTNFVDPSGHLFWAVIIAVAIRVAPIVARAVAASAAAAQSPRLQQLGNQLAQSISRTPTATIANQAARINHIITNHAAWASVADKSRFFPQYWSNTASTQYLIEGASRYARAYSAITPRLNGYTVVTHSQFPFYVGYTQSGIPTRWVTYVWQNGYLWTTHPGFPN